MKNWLQNISNKKEFAIILLIGLGWFIFISNYSSVRHMLMPDAVWVESISSYRFYTNVILEILLLCIILPVLKIRGFKISDFNLQFSFKIVGIGILLLLSDKLIAFSLTELFKLCGYAPHRFRRIEFSADIISTVLMLFINSFYEEFLLNGYIFQRLKNFSSNQIIFISVAIRMSYHTYQGWPAILFVMIFGLICSSYYARYKKLWPLIITHSLHNLIIFAPMYYNNFLRN